MAELTKQTLDQMVLTTEVASAADISTFVNTTASDTLGNANTYTDAEISALSADFGARIAALEGFTSFIGVKDSLPETAEDGQICIVGNKEYIYGSKVDGSTGWTELGDTTAEAAAIEELSTALDTKADITYVDEEISALETDVKAYSWANYEQSKRDISASIEALSADVHGRMDAEYLAAKDYTDTCISSLIDNEIYAAESNAIQYTDQKLDSLSSTFGDIVTHNVSEFDLSGSADAAEEAAISAAKAYTDEQIAAVEGEISSLTDVVETKADQVAVDAAISAINENISTLSAKAEEDPVFTAWKDGETVSLGSGADASNDNGPAIAIGTNASASNNGTAIGWDSVAYGIDAIAIGEGAHSESGVAIGKSAVSNGTNSIRIGTDAGADGDSLGAMVQLGSQEINPRADGSAEDVVFKVFGYTVLNDVGQIETTNLAGMSNLQDALNNVDEVTVSDDIAKLRATVNALAAAIKAFAGL